MKVVGNAERDELSSPATGGKIKRLKIVSEHLKQARFQRL